MPANTADRADSKLPLICRNVWPSRSREILAMATSRPTPDWRIYERFVASLQSERATDAVTIIPNTKLVGCITGIKRQVDVLIDARFQEDVSRRVIVDAKLRKRR